MCVVFYCYLLKCADGTYYCGWTKDLPHRLEMHNKGKGARYTRTRRPVALAYYEELESQSQAMRKERALKRKSHDQKSALIKEFTEPQHA